MVGRLGGLFFGNVLWLVELTVCKKIGRMGMVDEV